MKKVVLILMALCGLVWPVQAQGTSNKQDIPVQIEKVDGDRMVYGYILADGTVVVKPQYLEATDFSEGLAVVKDKQEHWYIIGPNGKRVATLPTDIERTGKFSEGLCWFRTKGKKCGFFNRLGKVVVRPQWGYAESFSGGLAAVGEATIWGGFMEYKDFLGFVNRQGKMVVSSDVLGARYHMHPPLFSENRCVLERGKDLIVIDKKGKVVAELKNRKMSSFSEKFTNGRCRIILKTQDDRELWGLIDTMGREVVSPKYTNMTYCSENRRGVSIMRGEQKLWGFLDAAGREVIAPRYEGVGVFEEGLCAVQIGDEWAYIDTAGREVFDRRFQSAEGFGEGLAFVVEKDGKPGFIDHGGVMKITILKGFTTHVKFKNGVVCVGKKEEIKEDTEGHETISSRTDWWLNREGRIIWRNSYDYYF